MGDKLVRRGLARRVARQFAAEQILDIENAILAFQEEGLTSEEQSAAHAELRRLAIEIVQPNLEDLPMPRP